MFEYKVPKNSITKVLVKTSLYLLALFFTIGFFLYYTLLLGANIGTIIKNLQVKTSNTNVAILPHIIASETIKFQDTIPPKVILEKSSINSDKESVSLFLASNEELQCGEFDYYKVTFQEHWKDLFIYTLTLINKRSNHEIIFTDTSGNETTKSFQLKDLQTLGVLSDSLDDTYEDGDNIFAIVDKEHSLSPIYYPQDLVYASEYNIPAVYGKFLLREIVIEDLMQLFNGTKTAGFYDLRVGSAYRSYQKQKDVYNYCIRTKGQEETDRICAKPGCSEHQLGTAIDFVSTQTTKFEQTEVSKWLEENAYKYGFILSYSQGSEEITGYKYEPWHFRYVGVDTAKEIYESEMLPVMFLQLVNFRSGISINKGL